METRKNTIAVIAPRDSKLIMAHMYVVFVALLIGGLMGLLQVLVRNGVQLLPFLDLNYYDVLTVHGVLLALVVTTFFIIGFMLSAMARTMGDLSDKVRMCGWIGFILMTLGTVLAAIMILTGQAGVLYTFYTPMTAHPIFYFGLVFVVVGSWVSVISMICKFFAWKKNHAGKMSPLLAFMVVINCLLWFFASLGVALEVLLQIIPLSLGWTDTINVLLSRTLFWYFGHPLVYFWLLSAYMCWYVVIPKVIGGKIFSDALARLAFILFLLLSIPVGFHHQLMEPGIDPGWKFLQVILTFLVALPSLMTAFSIFAIFETTGRSKGAKGLFGWVKKMPWNDARFTVVFIGMLAFIPAGAGGMVNASNQVNAVVHNTLWITGHFHLTIATAVLLTFFGIMYWLVPHLTGRVLTPAMNKLAIIQALLWAVGMTIMSAAMHLAGLFEGMPRRTDYVDYGGVADTSVFSTYTLFQAIGGIILFVAIVIVVYIFFNLALKAPKGEQEYPVAYQDSDSQATPKIFDNFKIWIVIMLLLILFAYTLPIMDMFGAPGAEIKKFW